MTDSPSLSETVTALTETRTRWPDLAETRYRGTPRYWAHTGGPSRGGRDADFTRAPLHLDVLDTMAFVLDMADRIAERVAQVLGRPRLNHPNDPEMDPAPWLSFTILWLPDAWQDEPTIRDWSQRKAAAMVEKVLTLLGEIVDGQLLGALCPFCCGFTYAKPAGVPTLRVRVIPDRRHPGQTEPVIVCENPDGCTPLAAECGLWVGRQPAWHRSEWDWLSARLLPLHPVSLLRA